MDLPGDLNLQGGELQNAKSHIYSSLPTYVSTDAGRLIYVSTGASQGFWFGNADGVGSWTKMHIGTSIGTWTITNQAVNNGVTDQSSPVATGDIPERGLATKITLSSSLSSGYVIIRLYEDVGRANMFYESTFDLSSALLVDRIPVGFELDNSAGTMYVDIVNNTGSNGTFSLEVETHSLATVPISAPPGAGSGISSGVAGEGISYDAVNTRLDVDLASNPGLQLTGAVGSKELSVLPDPAGGLTVGAAGVAAGATIVKTTTDQDIAGAKRFSGFGFQPSGISGPPVAGTWVAGQMSMDQNHDIWLCTTGGTPGTWVFWGWKETKQGGAADGSSYTGTIAAGASADVSFTLSSRRGVIRKAIFWGASPAYAAADLDVPFRVEAYPNEAYEGREMLWTLSGVIRTTYMSGVAGAGSVILPVNSVGSVALDDLIRLRKLAGTDAEEYGRIITRTPGGPSITVDEATVNALAANDPVMMCTEVLDMYWSNNSAIVANKQKLYLRFYNDDPVLSVIFGYDLHLEQIGGGNPI
jgi:hypothetical protein